MDVILLQDIDRLGNEGVVVQVKPGYARNFLLPHGLAVSASPEHMKAYEDRKRQTQLKAKRQLDACERLKQKLEGRSLTLPLSLGEGDKPFGSVTSHDIVQALAKEEIVVEKHAVELEAPIKSLGIYEVPVRLHPDVTAVVKVWVVKA